MHKQCVKGKRGSEIRGRVEKCINSVLQGQQLKILHDASL